MLLSVRGRRPYSEWALVRSLHLKKLNEMFHRVTFRECARSPEPDSIFGAFRLVVHKNELSRLRTAQDEAELVLHHGLVYFERE